jgi:hypothetical protein
MRFCCDNDIVTELCRVLLSKHAPAVRDAEATDVMGGAHKAAWLKRKLECYT